MGAVIEVNGFPVEHAIIGIGDVVNLDGLASTPVPTTYLWALLDQPTGAVDALSTTSGSSPTIQLNSTGAYLVQLVTDLGLPTEAEITLVMAVETQKKQLVVAAAGEELEFHPTKGWQAKLEALFQAVAIEGSFHRVSIGPEVGADFPTVSAAISSLAAFPIPVTDVVVLEMLEDYTEIGVQIPERVVLDGMGHRIAPSATLDLRAGTIRNFDITFANGNFIQVGDAGIGADKESEIENLYSKSNATATKTVVVDPGTGDKRVILKNVLGVDLTIGTDFQGVLAAKGSRFEDIIFPQGTLELLDTQWATLDVGPTPNIADVTVLRTFSTDGTITINPGTTGVTTLGAHSGLLVNSSPVSDVLTLEQRAELIFYDNTFSGLLAEDVQAAIDELSVLPPDPLQRDRILVGIGGFLSGVDIPLPFITYVKTGNPTDPDFNNLIIFVDGLVLTNSIATNNADSRDAYPGSTNATIKLDFAVVAGQIIQVVR